MSNTTVCPECKKQLTYTPSAETPFCELCGAKIFQSEDNSPRNNGKILHPRPE